MRTKVINGIDDNIKLELHGGLKLICAIMEIGKAKNPLTYEVCLNENQLIKILSECWPGDVSRFNIKEDNRYNVVAFDW